MIRGCSEPRKRLTGTAAKGAVDGNPRARLLLPAEPPWISALELRGVPCPQRTCEFSCERMSQAGELEVEVRALLGNESAESFVL